jgi:hypothetical protein
MNCKSFANDFSFQKSSLLTTSQPGFVCNRIFVSKQNKQTMKTKSVVFALVMALVSVAALAADPVGPKMVVVNQKDPSTFKVIYEGNANWKTYFKNIG